MVKARIEVERFDGKGDFSLWKKRMLAHLSVLGLKDVLQEDSEVIKSEKKKDEDESEFQERLKIEEIERSERSEKAMNLIILNVGDHVLRKIELCTNAATTWATLERLYLSKTLPNRIHLQHKFYTFKMKEAQTLDENIDEFLKIVSNLASVNVQVSEEVQAILLLNSLPNGYDYLKETLKYGRETLSIEEVTSAARSKELELKDSKDSGASSSQKNGEGLFARGRSEKKDSSGNNGKKGKGRSRSKSGSRVTCWFCKKEGHVKKDCYARKKKYGEEESAEATVVVDRTQLDDALSATDNWHKDKWILDSGCSYHMTYRRDWFDEFQEVSTGQVLLGDDNSVSVEGIGTVNVKTYGGTVKMLTNVRYIPKLKRNLISTGTLDLLGFNIQVEMGRLDSTRVGSWLCREP